MHFSRFFNKQVFFPVAVYFREVYTIWYCMKNMYFFLFLVFEQDLKPLLISSAFLPVISTMIIRVIWWLLTRWQYFFNTLWTHIYFGCCRNARLVCNPVNFDRIPYLFWINLNYQILYGFYDFLLSFTRDFYWKLRGKISFFDLIVRHMIFNMPWFRWPGCIFPLTENE